MSTLQEVYKKYGRKVYDFLLSLSGNETLAEELLQETFFQAFQHIGQFEGRCSLYTWLCQIGKNAWLKEIRRNKR
ncbi:MAG: RNA polymerase sigma factor, partial [Lachnospiraceae bacterium]|nr:RNA polymerase sigma factor [Lachnospiraceae bacterium]